MKKAIYSMSAIICAAFFLIGADFKSADSPQVATRKHCSGYTILEAGKGIDCYGDTVKLIRRGGFYELAENYEVQTDLNEIGAATSSKRESL